MSANVKKTAFLFPGQGVQTSIVCEHYKFLKNKEAIKTKKFIDTLQNSLNEISPQERFDVEESLANESLHSWEKTSFVQPLTYTLSILIFELIKNKNNSNYSPGYMLGHSLGAFSALTAAGSMPYEQGCRVVSARGKFMQEESDKADNGMIAVIGLTEDQAREICEKTNTKIALLNGPTAFVIGCARNVFPKVEQEASLMGAAKTIRLGTSGAFHTKAMQGAYEKFKKFFGGYSLLMPQIPVVTNMSGKGTNDPEELKNDCIESIVNAVNWMRMMNFLKEGQIDCYVESGPGTSLSSLCRINGIEKEKIVHARNILE